LAELARNLAAVRARVAAAAGRAGRDAGEVTVVAVSKTVPLECLRGAPAAGLADLGENRVQEAAPKIEALGHAVTWHLVGHLQSNKAKAATRLFDLIHSIDDVDLATALDRHAGALGKRQRVLFQVNVSGEESKSGFAPAQLRTVAERLAALPHLQPEGLMTIAPQGAGEDELRGVFRALRLLRDQLAPAFPGGSWRHLSMGMTDDYEIAVEEGATLVRVGRAIFGEHVLTGAGTSGRH
jgi:pyridoxal phosphate enzyme (YggS family)